MMIVSRSFNPLNYGWLVCSLLVGTGVRGEDIETPKYAVEKTEGNFEIREYPAMVAAAAESNGGFGILFRYISGDNERKQKIAMTSPVLMPAGPEGKPGEMMFLVPLDVVKSGVPKPKSDKISVKTVSGGRFAVLSSPGKFKDEDWRKLLAELQVKIKEKGLETTGEAIFAGYDPPWTPVPKRRNEVLLRLK